MTMPLPKIPFSVIERSFTLTAALGYPAVSKLDEPRGRVAYSIRVLKSERFHGANVSRTYDYFELAADGEVITAPRGYARDYKPARVTGLDEAVAKYAAVRS